jgi:TatD DNase family protein
MERLIDVHTHVQFARYDEDRDAVIRRALENDVWMINVGTQRDTSAFAVDIAEQYSEGVYAAVGLHPIHVEATYHDPDELGSSDDKGFSSRGEIFDHSYYKKLALHPKTLAIGECGLDHYHLGDETKKKQLQTLRAHIKLAVEVEKPLMLHCRDAASPGRASAYDDLIDELREAKKMYPNLLGNAHFFAGSKKHAKAFLELGFSFSFGGVTTFTHDYDEVIKYIGIDNIMLETDAPYVTPAPHRGRRNEPMHVRHVCDAMAALFDKSASEVAEITTRNAERVFGIRL